MKKYSHQICMKRNSHHTNMCGICGWVLEIYIYFFALKVSIVLKRKGIQRAESSQKREAEHLTRTNYKQTGHQAKLYRLTGHQAKPKNRYRHEISIKAPKTPLGENSEES